MAWVRDGEVPNEIKITFVVSKDKHPELAEWLWRQPYRQTSAVVRDVLNGAVRKLKYGGPNPARVEDGGGLLQAGKRESISTPVAHEARISVASEGADQGENDGMADAVVQLMREMDSEF